MSAQDSTADIVVVGSLNLDVSVVVDHLPTAGETVLGGDALWSPGGKGANQAVGARRLGRDVSMVGCVGDDDPGRQLLANLESDGVGHQHVAVIPDASTGFAAIAVGSDGDNQIVVSPGANGRVDADHIDAAADEIRNATVVLAQFELPLPTVLAAARLASGTFVLNPAPAPTVINGETRAELDGLLSLVSVVVPNQGELAALLGEDRAASLDEVAAQAARLAERGPRVVVTLGEQGALVLEDGEPSHVPALQVDAIDATAAGDSFCGALGDRLCDGATLTEAAEWAVQVAAVTVTRRGAQASLPTRDEVSQVR